MTSEMEMLSRIETPKVVYHYTSFEVLKHVITGCALRFGHVRPQNDEDEVVYFQDTAFAFLKNSDVDHESMCLYPFLFEFGVKEEERRTVTWNKVYTICFSEIGDCKSQWKEYADDDKGISFGIRTDYFTNRGFERLACDLCNDVGLFEKVVYDGGEIHGLLTQLIATDLTWFKGVYVFQNLCKPPEWHEEREWRLVYSPSPYPPINDQERTIAVNIVWKQNQPTKYSGPQMLPFVTLDQSDFPITEVTLGPHCKQTEQDIHDLLDVAGIARKHIKIKKSALRKRAAS